MQSSALKIAAGAAVLMPIPGRGFWYESGSSSTANPYIVVKPTSGGTEIRLKPGQSVQTGGDQSFWTITAEDQAAVITGQVIIGDGGFNDDNTANSIITNAAAMPVQKQALSTITDFAVVTIGTGAAQALVADPTQRVLRIRNGHASAILYLGGAGLTIAKAAIVLYPGDIWTEEEGAGASWFAISDTAGCNVQIQGLKL